MTVDFDRYYTRSHFAQLLVNSIGVQQPTRVLDLGVGHGALLRQAAGRWPEAEYWAADLDPDSHAALTDLRARLRFIPSDLLIHGLPESVLAAIGGTIDVAICNPPYTSRRDGSVNSSLLTAAGMDASHLPKLETGPVVFLAMLIACLRSNGELGVILPDGLIAGTRFNPVREMLVHQHGLQAVIELPTYAFSSTETRTYILLLRKSERTGERIPLFKADRNGRVVASVSVDKDAAIRRMDYSWHEWKQSTLSVPRTTLGDLGVEIIRSQAEVRDLRSLGVPFIHTSSLPQEPQQLKLKNTASISGFVLARPGDIIVARVGTRCIGRRAIVARGSAPISDCVYIVRSSPSLRQMIWSSLRSPTASDWLLANARGVCARYVTKSDLLRMPVYS